MATRYLLHNANICLLLWNNFCVHYEDVPLPRNLLIGVIKELTGRQLGGKRLGGSQTERMLGRRVESQESGISRRPHETQGKQDGKYIHEINEPRSST